MRLLSWLTAPEATNLGVALADDFVQRTTSPSPTKSKEFRSTTQTNAMQGCLGTFLQRLSNDVGPMRLNFFQRAKLANSFKWRLREKGIAPGIADELTQALVLGLMGSRVGSHIKEAVRPSSGRRGSAIQALIAKGDASLVAHAYAEAVVIYNEVLAVDCRNAKVRNSLGTALCELGRYKEAEAQFRRSIELRADKVEVHCNLGSLLRVMGRFVESETALYRAVKLKPTHTRALCKIGRA